MALLDRKELVYRHIKESGENINIDEIVETSPFSWFYDGKTYILVPMVPKAHDEKMNPNDCLISEICGKAEVKKGKSGIIIQRFKDRN